MPCTPFKHGRWNGLVDDVFSPHIPQLDSILQNGTALVDKPDRIVRRVVLDGNAYFAKSFLPSGKIGDMLKRAVRRPIPFRLWQIHNEMLAKGIGCAKPMLAALNSSGEQLFICTEVEFPTARTLLKSFPVEKLSVVITQAAQAIAKLHRAGFIHGDSLPGNICLGPDGTSAFIDNDRTSGMPPLFGSVARRRNLIQFCAHTTFRPEVNNEHYTLFLVEYMKAFVNVTPSTQTVADFIKLVNARIAEIQAQKTARK
ncbi:MAG: hypothetical protein IJS15_05180 [Victivallales bacterium]|nr:hypothetical protein [Victivallales bacterium]